MNDWSPWFVVGLVALVTLVFPSIYRKAKKALLRYQGFVPLADLLARKEVTAKEFWANAEARGIKVRVKHRREAPFVKAEEASAIVDSISRPSSRGQNLPEDIRLAAVTAIAAAAASSMFEETDDGHGAQGQGIPARPADDGPREEEEVVARGDCWTVTEVRTHWQGSSEGYQTRHYILIDPFKFGSPVELYSGLLAIPYPKSSHIMIKVRELGDWTCRTRGVAPQIRKWASRQNDSHAIRHDFTGLADAVQESLPHEVHRGCAEEFARSLHRDQYWSYFGLGRLLRTISNDRDNGVWGFVPVLMCEISIPVPTRRDLG